MALNLSAFKKETEAPEAPAAGGTLDLSAFSGSKPERPAATPAEPTIRVVAPKPSEVKFDVVGARPMVPSTGTQAVRPTSAVPETTISALPKDKVIAPNPEFARTKENILGAMDKRTKELKETNRLGVNVANPLRFIPGMPDAINLDSNNDDFESIVAKNLIQAPEYTINSIRDTKNVLFGKGIKELPKNQPGETYKPDVASYLGDEIGFYEYAKGQGFSEGEAKVLAATFGAGAGFLELAQIAGPLNVLSKKIIQATAKEAPVVSAWARLGYPKNMAEAQKSYYRLANELHPDKAGGNPAKFVEAKKAYAVLQEKGIPDGNAFTKNLRDSARALQTPVKDLIDNGFRLPPEVQEAYGNVRGLLPGQRPAGGKPQPNVGLQVQPMESVGRAGDAAAKPIIVNGKQIISARELPSIVGEVSKYATAKAFINSMSDIFDIKNPDVQAGLQQVYENTKALPPLPKIPAAKMDKSEFASPNATSDAADIQKLRNSIQEGKNVLKTGTVAGRKLSSDELDAVAQSVSNAQEKIGVEKKDGYSIEEISSDQIFAGSKNSSATADADPLIAEARKYKAAEDFVKAQGDIFYHATPTTFDKFDKSFLGTNTEFDNTQAGFYFADSLEQIDDFKNVLEKGFGGDFVNEGRKKTASELAKYRTIEKIAKKEKFFNLNYNAKDLTAREARDFAEFADKKMGGLYNLEGDVVNHKKMTDAQLGKFLRENVFVDDLDPDSSFWPQFTDQYLDEFVKYLEAKGYVGMISNYGRGKNEYLIFDPNILPTKEQLVDIWNKANATGLPPLPKLRKTQKQAVAQAVAGQPKAIKQVAQETGILEPNVRRILGVGAKEGTFERVSEGVYVLKDASGKESAYIEIGDAKESLARMAKEGKTFNSVILDPAYFSRALIGGNRGIKAWDFIMPADFADVMKSVSKLVADDKTHTYLMLSGARTAQVDMAKYIKGATDAGFKAVGEGSYKKLNKDGSPVTNVRGEEAAAERLILLTLSGEARVGEIPTELNFRFVRPSIAKSYATEKPAELMKALIEQSTLRGESVLDPFAGSGVTGAEAVKVDRVPTLIEKSADTVERFTKPRVEKAANKRIGLMDYDSTYTPRMNELIAEAQKNGDTFPYTKMTKEEQAIVDRALNKGLSGMMEESQAKEAAKPAPVAASPAEGGGAGKPPVEPPQAGVAEQPEGDDAKEWWESLFEDDLPVAETKPVPDIAAAEKQLQDIYRAHPSAQEELASLAFEMELAEAGQRIYIDTTEWYGTNEGMKVLGIPSSFPKWVPEELRSKDLFSDVLGGLRNLNELRFPDGAQGRRRAIYNVILNQLDKKIGADTKLLRDGILKAYEPEYRKATRIAENDRARVARSQAIEAGKTVKAVERAQERRLKEDQRKALGDLKRGGPAPEKITKTEPQLLKDRLRNEARGSKYGFRAGVKAAREKILASLRVSKAHIASNKKAIVDYSNEYLPLKERGRLLNMVAKAETQGDLIDAFLRIDRTIQDVEKKSAIVDLRDKLRKIADSPSIAVEYKLRVKNLISDLELQGHREDTLARLRKTKEYFDQQEAAGKDVFMPRELAKELEILARKPIADLTVAGIENVFAKIEDLEALGRAKQQSRESLYNLEKERKTAELLAETKPIVKTPEIKKEIGKDLTPGQGFKNSFINAWNNVKGLDLAITPMDVFFDMLGGSKGTYDGAPFRIFKQTTDTNYQAYLDKRKSLMDDVIAKFEELGLDRGSMERIGIHAARVQEDGMDKLFASGFTPKEIDSIILTPKEQQFYDLMRQKLDEVRPEIERVMRNVYNEELGKVDNYFSFVTDFDALDDVEVFQRFGAKADEFGGLPRKNVEKGFTIKRVGGAQKIKVNALEIYARHMDNVAYLLNMARDNKMLFEIANSPEFGAAAGEVGQRVTLEWIDLVSRKGGVENSQKIPWLDALRRNVGIARLGFKLSSMLIQPTALFDGAAAIGPWAFRGMRDVVTDANIRAFVKEHMPEIRERVGDDRAYSDGFDSFSWIEKARKAGFVPLKFLDGMTAQSIGWGAYLKKMKELGLAVDLSNPNAEAATYAQRVVRRTQASPQFKDEPLAVSRGSFIKNRTFARALLQFQTFVLNRWSAIRYDMIQAGFVGAKDPKKGFNILFWLTMAVLAEEGIRQGASEIQDAVTGRDDSKDREYFENVGLSALSTIPFVSQVISTAIYETNPIPSFQSPVDFFKGTIGVFSAEKGTTKARNAATAAGAVGGVFGIPGSAQASQLIRGAIPATNAKKSKTSGGLPRLPSLPKLPKLPSLPRL